MRYDRSGRGDFGGRGQGSRGTGALARPVLIKEQLDSQLEAYMSKKKKGHLDAELGTYKVQTDPEPMSEACLPSREGLLLKLSPL